MKISRSAYKPQSENSYKAKCSPTGHERSSVRGREDLVRESEHKIQHAVENQLQRVNDVPGRQDAHPHNSIAYGSPCTVARALVPNADPVIFMRKSTCKGFVLVIIVNTLYSSYSPLCRQIPVGSVW